MPSSIAPLAFALGLFACAALPGTALGQGCTDTDGDAVCDPEDNCLAHFQLPTQFCDTDHDGFGNLCDIDFDNNLVSGPTADALLTFGMNFGWSGDRVTDLNCDEMTGIPDWGLFNQLPFGPPGPSGLACAGTIPCP